MQWIYPEILADTYLTLWRTCQYKTCRQREAQMMWLRRQEDLPNSRRRYALYRVAVVLEADNVDVYYRCPAPGSDRQ